MDDFYDWMMDPAEREPDEKIGRIELFHRNRALLARKRTQDSRAEAKVVDAIRRAQVAATTKARTGR